MTLRALAFCIFCVSLTSSARAQEQASPEHGHVHCEMRNVMYHFTDSIAVHIIHLEGELVPTANGGMPVFDDANSFNLAIRSAEISITLDALANALNQFAFAASDSPIKSVRISPVGNRIKIQGRLHSKGDLPFETEGSLSVTPDGDIRVHTEKVSAAHLPVKGIMDLLG